MKFSLSTLLLAASVAEPVFAKSAATKFPTIKRDSGLTEPRSENSLSNLLSNAVSNNPVIVVLWSFAGGNAATQSVGSTLTVTQTVSVPGKAVATSAATTTTAANKDAAATTTAATSTAHLGGTGTSSLPAGATHTVVVGGSQGLSYFPQSLNASVGDIIQFQFLSQNHTITQSTFEDPCKPLAGGMDSGFMPNVNNSVVPAPAMAMQVMTSSPLWMYCAQGNHCGRGMVFSINPTAAKTHAQFQARAINSTGKGLTGSPITGGTAVPAAAAPASTSATPTKVAAPSSVNNGVVTGTGTLQADGSCLCSVQCAAGSFPVAAQGIDSFGGVSGSIPMAQAAGVKRSTRRVRRHFW